MGKLKEVKKVVGQGEKEKKWKCKNRFELHNKIIEKGKVKNIKSNYIYIQKVKEK